MMVNFKKFNDSFKDAYLPKKESIREQKEAQSFEDDDFVEGCGAMSDYLKESLEREDSSVSK